MLHGQVGTSAGAILGRRAWMSNVCGVLRVCAAVSRSPDSRNRVRPKVFARHLENHLRRNGPSFGTANERPQALTLRKKNSAAAAIFRAVVAKSRRGLRDGVAAPPPTDLDPFQ